MTKEQARCATMAITKGFVAALLWPFGSLSSDPVLAVLILWLLIDAVDDIWYALNEPEVQP